MRKVYVVKAVFKTQPNGVRYRDAFTLAEDLGALGALLTTRPECRLVVIDPAGDYMGGAVDSDKDTKVRSILQPVADLAERHDLAVLLVCHYRKGEATLADDKIMGSRAFTALPRNTWHLMNDDANDRRLMLAGKSNLAKQAAGLAFTVEAVPVPRITRPVPVIRWDAAPVPSTADAWLAEQRGEGRPGPKPEKSHAAEEFLRDLFAAKPVIASAEVLNAAALSGINEKTLRRAKEKLGVFCWRDGAGRQAPWFWSLKPRHPMPVPSTN